MAVTTFAATGDTQTFTVPEGGTYQITCRGAGGGGAAGGYGAIVVADVELAAGQTLTVIVGTRPTTSQNTSFGGGGGSFVYTGNTLYVAAGGGGGQYDSGRDAHSNASLTTSGQTAPTGAPGTAGVDGQGGGGGSWPGGGAGWLSDGGSALNLANTGGLTKPSWAGANPGSGFTPGGFGGGGGTHGNTGGGAGGGGYSGGGGGHQTDSNGGGGGGGSYNLGTRVSAQLYGALEDGMVSIELLWGGGSSGVVASSDQFGAIDTTGFELGTYEVQVRTGDSGLLGDWSALVTFEVVQPGDIASGVSAVSGELFLAQALHGSSAGATVVPSVELIRYKAHPEVVARDAEAVVVDGYAHVADPSNDFGQAFRHQAVGWYYTPPTETEAKFRAISAGRGTVEAGLGVAFASSGQAPGAAGASGTLGVAAPSEGVVGGQAQVSGALGAERAVEGAATGSSQVSAEATPVFGLVGTSLGSATVAADVDVLRLSPLEASSVGSASVAADALVTRGLSGSAAGQAGVVGQVIIHFGLTSTSPGRGSVSGSLQMAFGLAAGSTGAAATQGNVSGPIPLQGDVSAGISAVVGRLGISAFSSASSAGVAAVTANLKLLIPTPYQRAVMADEPASYLRFDELSGTQAVDASGNGRVGTYVGTVTHAAERLIPTDTSEENAVALPGGTSGGYVDISPGRNLFGSDIVHSVEMWVQTTAPVSSLWSWRDSGANYYEYAQFTFSGQLIVAGRSPTASYTLNNVNPQGPNLKDGNPHHIVYSRRIDGADLYADGALFYSANIPAIELPSSLKFHIGAHPNVTWLNRYNGVVDDFAFYHQPLTATQVSAHYGASRALAVAIAGMASTVATLQIAMQVIETFEGNVGLAREFALEWFGQVSKSGQPRVPMSSRGREMAGAQRTHYR